MIAVADDSTADDIYVEVCPAPDPFVVFLLLDRVGRAGGVDCAGCMGCVLSSELLVIYLSPGSVVAMGVRAFGYRSNCLTGCD